MRVIRPAPPADRRWLVATALGMLVVGCAAILIMALAPAGRPEAKAALGLSAALALGVGVGWLLRARRTRPGSGDEDVARLLGTVFDDDYLLMLSPQLPGVSRDLAGLLVGPPGVRALIARRWQGRYRVRGRAWEYDTRDRRRGWIACRTNPSFEGDEVSEAVARWAATAAGESSLPIAPAVVFPRSHSTVILEEPEIEVVTTDNAPWWGQSIGRLQRMDGQRIGRFVQAVIESVDGPAPLLPAAEENGTRA